MKRKGNLQSARDFICPRNPSSCSNVFGGRRKKKVKKLKEEEKEGER